MYSIQKVFRDFRAVSPALISGYNLIGLKPAITYEIIHSTIARIFARREMTVTIKNDLKIQSRELINKVYEK